MRCESGGASGAVCQSEAVCSVDFEGNVWRFCDECVVAESFLMWHDEEDQIANAHTDVSGECCDTCGDRAVFSSSVWDGVSGVSVPSFLCGECGAVAIGEQGYEVGRDLFRLVK